MKLFEVLDEQCFLTENQLNIINAGNKEIEITDSDGETVDVIHPLPKIMDKFLKGDIFNARTPNEVKTWFQRNFVNWIKKGAEDRPNDMIDDEQFRKIFYVPLEEYIDRILSVNQDKVEEGTLSKEIVFESFPEFVQNNPNNAVVFSGGRLFRMKKTTSAVQPLQDYLTAVVQNKEDRNETLMPADFMVKKLEQLQVPEAFKRSRAWHRYQEQQAAKVDLEKAKQLVGELKEGQDYTVLDRIDNTVFVQLTSDKAAHHEGMIMKHCVASYGKDIEKGRTTVVSARDKETGIPVATMEIQGNKAPQVKGKHNSTISPDHHDAIRQFFKKNKIDVSKSEARNFGGMKSDKDQSDRE